VYEGNHLPIQNAKSNQVAQARKASTQASRGRAGHHVEHVFRYGITPYIQGPKARNQGRQWPHTEAIMSGTKYRYHWLFGAAIFFVVCAGLSWNLARAYTLGYWRDILNTQFDTAIYFGAAGLSLIMTLVCLNNSEPLDLLNYITRLEQENRQLRKAIKIYRDNPSGAIERNLAGRILDKIGDGENVVVRSIGARKDA
jgi:hypothetical protein